MINGEPGGDGSTPIAQGGIERHPQGIQPLDVWMVNRIQQERQRRGLGEGERLDPYYVSDAFLDYKEQIVAAEMRVRGFLKTKPAESVRERAERHSQEMKETRETETREEKEFFDSANRVYHAYDIVAYPYYNAEAQMAISGEVHGSKKFGTEPVKSIEPFVLDEGEKRILQTITKAMDIPDDPQQRIYSFTSIPPVAQIVDSEA